MPARPMSGARNTAEPTQQTLDLASVESTSSPTERWGLRACAPVAQRIELLTSDQAAGGSNPSGRASLFPHRDRGFEPEAAPTNRRKSATLRSASAADEAGRPLARTRGRGRAQPSGTAI